MSRLFTLMLLALCLTIRAEATGTAVKSLQEAVPITQEAVITLPHGHFFENLAFQDDHTLVATDYSGRSLYRFHEQEGARLWAKVPGHPVAIRFLPDGAGLLSVHRVPIDAGPAFAHTMALFAASSQGELTQVYELEFPAFLNGMAHLEERTFLLADALNGKIYRYDLNNNTLTTWLEHPDLTPDPERPGLPGVNGIQLVGSTLYFTNSARQLLGQVPVEQGKAGELKVLHRQIQADDFVIRPSGDWLLTTHHSEILTVSPQGEVTVLLDKGLEGNTAIQPSPQRPNTYYVTSDGGLLFGGNAPATLTRLVLP